MINDIVYGDQIIYKGEQYIHRLGSIHYSCDEDSRDIITVIDSTEGLKYNGEFKDFFKPLENPSQRRSGMVNYYHIECSLEVFKINFYQHKGEEFIEEEPCYADEIEVIKQWFSLIKVLT